MGNKTALLALDLGTLAGYAYNATATVSGVLDLRPKRFEGGGMRYLRFSRWLDELHATTPIGEVVFEEVRRHAGTDAAHVYGGLMSHLQAWCDGQKPPVPYRGIPVGTIKKFATGKGNASKDEMKDAVRAWGFEPADDNEADALAILRLAATETGRILS